MFKVSAVALAAMALVVPSGPSLPASAQMAPPAADGERLALIWPRRHGV